MKNWTQDMLPLRIIEDLGVVKFSEKTKEKARHMLFECPNCNKPFKAQPSKVLAKTTTRCKPCAIKSNSAPAIVNGYKVCTVCRVSKPITEFFKSSYRVAGYDSRCKECANNYKTKWLEKTQIDVKEQRKNTKYLKRYGITLEDYNTLNEKQDGKCAICGNTPAQGRSKDIRLAVDHCHDTGKVRGLLCQKCNTGIGLLGDKEETLLKALKYLQQK